MSKAATWVVGLGAAAGLAFVLREKPITEKNGVRVFSKAARDKALKALAGTELDSVDMPGQFAMRVVESTGSGVPTLKFVSANQDDGGVIYASDSILDLKADADPDLVNVILVADVSPDDGPFIAGPDSGFARLLP